MTEIVIKIPDDVYKDIMTHNRERREGGKSAYYFEGLIQNGTELPKGHTELIDTKELIQDFAKAEESMKDNGVTPVFDVHEITNMILSQTVIVNADEGNEE